MSAVPPIIKGIAEQFDEAREDVDPHEFAIELNSAFAAATTGGDTITATLSVETDTNTMGLEVADLEAVASKLALVAAGTMRLANKAVRLLGTEAQTDRDAALNAGTIVLQISAALSELAILRGLRA